MKSTPSISDSYLGLGVNLCHEYESLKGEGVFESRNIISRAMGLFNYWSVRR